MVATVKWILLQRQRQRLFGDRLLSDGWLADDGEGKALHLMRRRIEVPQPLIQTVSDCLDCWK